MTLLTKLSVAFTIASLVFINVLALLNLLAGKRRSWRCGLLRIGTTLLSAGLSIPLTPVIVDLLGDFLEKPLLSLLGTLIKNVDDVATVGVEGLLSLAMLIVAPLIYLLIFALLRALLAIVVRILEDVVPVFAKEKKNPRASLPMGAGNGLLIALVCLIPLCGTLAVAGDVMGTFAESAKSCDSAAVDNMLAKMDTDVEHLEDEADRFRRNPIVMVVHGTIGRPIYNFLTTDTLDESVTGGKTVKVNLNHELNVLAGAAVYAMDVADVFDDTGFTADDKIRLMEAADRFVESDWARYFVADMLVEISDSWLHGETVFGIDRPAADPMLVPVFDSFLEVLATENADILREDLHTVMDILGDLLVSGIMDDYIDPADTIRAISRNGLMTATLRKIEENEHLSPIADELRALSVRLVGNLLGVDGLKNGEHEALITDVTEQLNAALDMTDAERAETIHEVFSQYDFDVPEDVALELSGQFLKELGADGEITNGELTDYLVTMAESGYLPGVSADGSGTEAQ